MQKDVSCTTLARAPHVACSTICARFKPSAAKAGWCSLRAAQSPCPKGLPPSSPPSSALFRCLQTFADPVLYYPENTLSALAFDAKRGRIVTAPTHPVVWSMRTHVIASTQQNYSGHTKALVGALYNPNFHQVLSAGNRGGRRPGPPLSFAGPALWPDMGRTTTQHNTVRTHAGHGLVALPPGGGGV